ncbi:hypothetical protein GCM10022419_112280 [Nonomuraea rosea]|uniref:HIT family protein n=1 Tax=Nonomuraea rosea TaxID=638574 RepID=A0ABP6ZH40_9ACTN
MSDNHTCPYCHLSAATDEPPGGWVHRDEFWLVHHGPAGTSRPGTMKIISRRHFVDFADMTASETATFGPLLSRLDIALHATTDAERVHLISTRDRVQHFHAWLYPRPASHPLRSIDFLAAPQHSDPAEVDSVAEAVRRRLTAATG